MLKRLTVENYALIDRLELDFSTSLNTITGETGAGKSILLGALGLLQGNRADTSVLKDLERNCIVEGMFEIESYNLRDFFVEHDLDYSPTTVIRRVISPAGKSRAYINDLPVQITNLKEFGSYLIDIHSQHQSLMITEDGFRINILDSVAGHSALVAEYSTTYHAMRSSERELARLREDMERSRNDQEWLTFQVEQLDQADLDEDEQEELEVLQKELFHAEEIKNSLGNASQILDDGEDGVLLRLRTVEQEVAHISSYYTAGEEISARIHSARIELQDIEQELSLECERIESDPSKLQKTEDRLNTMYSLQQRHKVLNNRELIALHEEYKRRLSSIMDGGEEIVVMEKKIEKLLVQATALADKITVGRTASAKKVTAHVEQMLAELGMPGSKFVVELTQANALRATGMDNIRFLFSANKNIEPAPVEKIASGGEISRVMLALKTLVAKSSNLPTIIFDEIDAGVSGRIADAMGRCILDLAQSMQVINITHLPQIASQGETHFYVYKESDSRTSCTMIRQLSAAERIEEIAKMLSGSTTTEAATTQARLLLNL